MLVPMLLLLLVQKTLPLLMRILISMKSLLQCFLLRLLPRARERI